MNMLVFMNVSNNCMAATKRSFEKFNMIRTDGLGNTRAVMFQQTVFLF